MDLVFLTQVGGILGPFAWVMGKIFNGIYNFLSFFGIENIAVCIILFTIVVKMLMLPLTIKQQKGAKLSAKMNPEIMKIQEKYKGKKDQASMQQQQAEMQEVYSKYGTSPMAGCLPLLITFPILFALYKVIYAIPAYVTDINAMYSVVAAQFANLPDYATQLQQFITDNNIAVRVSSSLLKEPTKLILIDVFSNFNTDSWKAFTETFTTVAANADVTTAIDKIIHVNKLIGSTNILDIPNWKSIEILVPILAGGSQWLNSKLMMADNKNQKQPGGDTMKAMNNIMPIMSAGFCLFMPIGVGLYWIASSVVTVIQQIFINNYFKKIDLDEMIQKNVAKSNKKKEKLGIATGNKMAGVAKTSTKSIPEKMKTSVPVSSNKNVNQPKSSHSDYKKSEVSYKAGSIAANANILKRNSDKGDK